MKLRTVHANTSRTKRKYTCWLPSMMNMENPEMGNYLCKLFNLEFR